MLWLVFVPPTMLDDHPTACHRLVSVGRRWSSLPGCQMSQTMPLACLMMVGPTMVPMMVLRFGHRLRHQSELDPRPQCQSNCSVAQWVRQLLDGRSRRSRCPAIRRCQTVAGRRRSRSAAVVQLGRAELESGLSPTGALVPCRQWLLVELLQRVECQIAWQRQPHDCLAVRSAPADVVVAQLPLGYQPLVDPSR